MKGPICSVITPSLGLASPPEVTTPSYTLPFTLCLRNKRTNQTGPSEANFATPTVTPPKTSETSAFTIASPPVPVVVVAPVATKTTATAAMSVTAATTTFVTAISGPKTAAFPVEENTEIVDMPKETSHSDIVRAMNENPTDHIQTKNKLCVLSNQGKRGAMSINDKYYLHSVVGENSDNSQPHPDSKMSTDPVITTTNILTLHTKCIAHHKPFSKSKHCQNERHTAPQQIPNSGPGLESITENGHRSCLKYNIEAGNANHLHRKSDDFEIVCSIDNTKFSDSDGLRSKSFLPDGVSQHVPKKWIIKRDFRSSNLFGTAYGEQKNVWLQDDLLHHTNDTEHMTDLRCDFTEKSEHLSAKHGIFGPTPPSTENLKCQTSYYDHEIKPTNSRCVVSQTKTVKSTNLDALPSSLSAAWLSRSLRQLHKASSEKFKDSRFLGNKLISKEIHCNRPISRELIYRQNLQCREVNSDDIEMRQRSSNRVKTSTGKVDLALHTLSQNQSTFINLLSCSPYTSTAISSLPDCTKAVNKASEIPLKQSSSIIPASQFILSSSTIDKPYNSSQTTKEEKEKDSDLIMQSSGISETSNTPCPEYNTSCEGKHRNSDSTVNAALRHVQSDYADKNECKAKFHISRDKNKERLRCQEMLDYFWSYQGLGRQVLGLESTTSFSLQSSMWEREKMFAGVTKYKLLRDQGKQHSHDPVFSKYRALPPILVTDYDADIDMTSCDTRLLSEIEQNNKPDRPAHSSGQKGKKKRGKKHRSRSYSRSVLEKTELNLPQQTETRETNKIRLVVKLPLQQKSEEEDEFS
ncbi:hypothetical protein ElyMa_001732100 [Elysia marginata]|uniref:Uncharacterized protein n=1 Tax=Elysia marginata TaxID=1093978 RepID=A0AAV4JZA8_9GAST|nr:hypothetical protein ElyMa_001732100 [Elysia marginata]